MQFTTETPEARIDRLILGGTFRLLEHGLGMWCCFCKAAILVHDTSPATHEQITECAWRYNDHICACPNNPYSDTNN